MTNAEKPEQPGDKLAAENFRQKLVEKGLADCKAHVATFLRSRRRALELTQAAVAGMAGCSTGTIFLLERGNHPLTLKTLVILAHVLQAELVDFFPKKPDPTINRRFLDDILHQTDAARAALDRQSAAAKDSLDRQSEAARYELDRQAAVIRQALDRLDELSKSQSNGG